uniref:Uncharacterized protein n=1 Tax=Octactis speculum TaxID=3111310 RepID=A0A7S2B9C6_9STRA
MNGTLYYRMEGSENARRLTYIPGAITRLAPKEDSTHQAYGAREGSEEANSMVRKQKTLPIKPIQVEKSWQTRNGSTPARRIFGLFTNMDCVPNMKIATVTATPPRSL